MKKLCIIGFLIVSILGVIFHFMYDYLPIFIFPKNESIFEHTKLIIIPMLIYLFIVIFCVENKKKIFASFISAILIGVFITVVSYYTYYGMLGFSVDWLNIVIYFISVFSMVDVLLLINSWHLLIILVIASLVFVSLILDSRLAHTVDISLNSLCINWTHG